MGKKAPFKNADLASMEKDRAGIDDRMKQFNDALKNDKSDAEKWYDPASGVTGWKTIKIPELWEHTEIGNVDGIIWFKKEFELPPGMEGKQVILSLGPIDDIDVTYINGIKAGSINAYNKDRVYNIDPAVLKKGKNVIIIKVTDNIGGGGLYGS